MKTNSNTHVEENELCAYEPSSLRAARRGLAKLREELGVAQAALAALPQDSEEWRAARQQCQQLKAQEVAAQRTLLCELERFQQSHVQFTKARLSMACDALHRTRQRLHLMEARH